jgi:SHS2 domain-containing protein
LRQYEFISHTAEVGLRLTADNPLELFRAALEGMAEWLKPGLPREVEFRRDLRVDSALAQTLLVDFLVDALTRSQVERAVFFDAEFGLIEDTRVEATLLGRRVESFDDDIKAITYHGAGFRRNGDGQYETEVIFDI